MIPNLLGRTVTLRRPYHGYRTGVVVELLGRNCWDVPMYGLRLGRYPNVCDFAYSEFDDEHGEAYLEQMNKLKGQA